MIVRGGADDYRQQFPSGHGDRVEVIVLSLAEFEAHAAIGSPSEWNRYTFAHVTPEIDKLAGRIAELAREKGRLSPDVARERAAAELDTYLNALYRSAKSFRAGLEAEGHLDAAESVPPLLATLFALENRVRPYNKFLDWELRTHPLAPAFCEASLFLLRLRSIVAAGVLAEQQALFRDIEPYAREQGLGHVVAAWEPDVDLFRGED